MGVEFVREQRVSAPGLHDYLPEISYRVAISPHELDEVYRLRYRAYLRERSIQPSRSEIFTDDYDRMDNGWIVGVHSEDQLIGTIRFHVISKRRRLGPALDVFPDIIHPLVDAGKVIIDPTRFVCDVAAKRRYPELAYVTLRVPSMASLAFDADYCLATVKESHQSFYEHIFDAKALSDARPYPALRHRICLMQVDIGKVRDQLWDRHSAYHTTVEDWRLFFEQAAVAREAEPVATVAPAF